MGVVGLPQPQDTVAPVSAQQFPVGQKQPLVAVTVPLKATDAVLSLDSTWHTDPASIAVWGLDQSLDGGKTWTHLCTVTRNGGPALAEDGSPLTVFDVSCPMFLVDDGGNVFFDLRGGMIRPFLGVLKGSDTAPITPNGSITFKTAAAVSLGT